MSTAAAVLAFVGLALGLIIALVVVMLFNGIIRPAGEIKRYAGDILAAGVQITKNLDGVDEALRTRELATGVPDLAVAYLKKLGAV